MSQQPWRIVVITTLGPLAQQFDDVVKAFGHRMVGILTSPGPPKNRSSSYLEVVNNTRPGIDLIVSTRPQTWARMIAPLRPDLIICTGFPWLIPNDVLNLPPLGTINLHPSILPKYRGPNPIGWSFRNDDPEVGMTIHRMDGAFDTGNILAAGTIPLDDESDMSSVIGQLGYLGVQLLGTALARVAQGDPGDPQPAEGASEAPFFEPEWQYIDWTNPRRTIHNQVRSWTGDRNILRGALGQIDGQTHRVLKTRLIERVHSISGDPGTVLQRTADMLLMQCGDGPLEIVQYQPEA